MKLVEILFQLWTTFWFLLLVSVSVNAQSSSSSPSVDIIFAIDESTSMGPGQAGVKTQVSFLFRKMANLVPNFRMGIVGFGQKDRIGSPTVRQVLTSNQTEFKLAVKSLRSIGSREPGYQAVQEIAANNVGGLALNTNPNYPDAFPGSQGYCVVLLSDEDSDGVETLQDTITAVLQTHGHFFAVTTGQKDYIDLAIATGGTSRQLVNFIGDSRPILRQILNTCVERVQCNSTTYHIWDSVNNVEVDLLTNNWIGCIREPFNLEIRLCTFPLNPPIQFQLKNDHGYNVKTKEFTSPWMMFGDNTKGDIYDNTQSLPDGTYRLYTTIDGRTKFITFTQACGSSS